MTTQHPYTIEPTLAQAKRQSLLAAELDDAELAERAALAVHDGCRARLRAARSHYRAAVRFSIAPHEATDEQRANLRRLYDDLCVLGASDREVIDVAAQIEAIGGIGP
jgi:hypothetical protein